MGGKKLERSYMQKELSRSERKPTRKRVKPVRAWCPKVGKTLWVKWIHGSERGVRDHMRLNAAGYPFIPVRVEIREVKR